MIEISRKHREPLVVKDAHTVDEAVEYMARNHISLEGADLSATDLSWTDLSGANLSGADLSGADLSYAYLFHADLSQADLSYANLSHSNLRGVDLTDASLRRADLSHANLSCADLRCADLSRADLSGANIDFSCLPLWCGSLDMKIDKKIFCQLLYHTLRAGKSVKDEEVQKILSNPENITMANQFHRAVECGKIRGK